MFKILKKKKLSILKGNHKNTKIKCNPRSIIIDVKLKTNLVQKKPLEVRVENQLGK